MPVSQEAERTTIAVDPKVRNAAKAAAALEGKGLREWVEELILDATKANGKK